MGWVLYTFLLAAGALFPFVGLCQDQASEPQRLSCGEQCVRLLCGAYGKNAAPEDILRRLSLNERGECSLADVERCLDYLGLEAVAFKSTQGDLTKLMVPMVLHFRRTEQLMLLDISLSHCGIPGRKN